MTGITFKGQPIHTIGSLPMVGSTAPEFTLTKVDLSDINSKELIGHKVILNIFPSLDTSVCGIAVQTFNKRHHEIPNVKIVCVSADLPFAAGRFCETNKISATIHASTFRHPEFGQTFGVTITEGPLRGLLSRAVVVLDEQGRVLYTEQVAEITDEPNYEAAITAAR